MAKQNQNNAEEVTYTEAKTNESTENTSKANGKDNPDANNNQKVVSHPRDVAALVMAQLNNVNNKKDDLTIAIKSLADTTDQLVKAYAGNMQIIQQLSKRIQELENK